MIRLNTLRLDRELGRIVDTDGRCFDPDAVHWVPGLSPQVAGEGTPVSVREALAWLQSRRPPFVRAPISVIGPGDTDAERIAAAEAVGAGLARLGLTVVTGGLGGVMAAAAKGATEAGGTVVGLLPGRETHTANPWITVPLSTNLGEARNAVIANCAAALIAVGNSLGTLSEVAMGLRIGKPVFGIAGAAEVPGLIRCAGPEEALDALARRLLALT